MTREPVVKAYTEGKWEELSSQETHFEEHKVQLVFISFVIIEIKISW